MAPMGTPPSERNFFESRNRAAIRAAQRILKLVKSGRQRSQGTQASSDAPAFNLMLDKAEKTARGALLLANRGHVEDAFILARSLVNLAINVSYLSTRDTERFISYRATGKIARRRMAQRAGATPIDEDRTDWEDAAKRARRWQAPGAISQRAAKAGCTDLYEHAYRHGSSYEHSDAWSLLTYESGQWRSRAIVFHLTMLVIAYSLTKTHEARGQFFGVSDPTTDTAIKAHFLAAFPQKPTAAPTRARPRGCGAA
jgi:hypothetical protein